MSKTLGQELQDALESYSVNVEYWDPGAGDTFILLGQREFLQKNIGTLSEDQRTRMEAVDRRVLELSAARYPIPDEQGDDVRTLRFVADLIMGNALPGGAIP